MNYVTKTGRVLTDEDIEALAAEAEQGYQIEDLKPQDRALVGMELDSYEIRLMLRSLKQQITKLEKTNAKQKFVPEPGKVNVTEQVLKTAYPLRERLFAALNEALNAGRARKKEQQ